MAQPYRLHRTSPFIAAATPASLADRRIIALARAACAEQRPLRLIFLRGYWRAADLRRVAAAAIAMGVEIGDIPLEGAAAAQAHLQRRLASLLADAPLLRAGVHSLAEHLGGRAPEHLDRLRVIPQLADPTTP